MSEAWNEWVEHYTRLSTFDIYNIVKEMRRLTQRGTVKKLVLRHSISSFASSKVSTPVYSVSRTSSTVSSNSSSPTKEGLPMAV